MAAAGGRPRGGPARPRLTVSVPDETPRRAAHDGASSFPPPFIDSHAHLGGEAFEADREAALARLRAAGGQGVVCIGESLAAAEGARRLAVAHPGEIWWTAGIHPHDAAAYEAVRDRPALEAAMREGAVAVGECGLDYHYDHSPRAQQRLAFADQLAIAQAHRKAVVVHTRDAAEDTAAMVREAGDAGIVGVLHCFTGPAALAEVALAAGWYVSFSGVVTFRKWDDLDLLRAVPEDRLLLESDSPYLAPVPQRGKRNEPAWCAYTLERLAQVRDVDPGALGAAVVRNTRRCFSLA